MLDQKILSSAASSKRAWEELSTLEAFNDLGEASKVIWKEISTFYKKDPEAEHIDKTIIKERLKSKFPKQDHFEQFSAIVDTLTKISEINLVDLVRETRLDALAQEMAVNLVDHKYDKVDKQIESYEQLRVGTVADPESGILRAPTHEELLELRDRGDRIKVAPGALNNSLAGGPRWGNNIFLFARPEVGKTACAITMAYGFLVQGYTTLYMGNEEPAEDVLERIKSRCCNAPIGWVRDHPQEADARAIEKGYGNLVFWEPEMGGTILELEQKVDLVKPKVVIIDQMRNMQSAGEGEHQKYEALGKIIRDMAKKQKFVAICLGQAGAEAEDKAVLTQNDIYGSKTGVQGAFDTILGVGATYEMIERGELCITPVKNKIGSVHRPIKLRLDKQRSKVY